MAHTFVWPGKTFFYPIGNTSAVCLTQDLAPESAANILLLGCGDPRNILYTVFASGADSSPISRNLDFTCCDIESAVLARNVILLTLLADDGALERIPQIWNIFYHFYLDNDSSLLLMSHCRKLAELGRDIDTWKNGEYASFLKMCTSQTLSDLRRFWLLYVQTEDLTSQERERIAAGFSSGMKSVGSEKLGKSTFNMTASRSAGPLSAYALSVLSSHFIRFWNSGSTASDNSAEEHVNATFVYSAAGDKFAVHYGTDPLLSFHLAEAFASIRDSSKSASQSVAIDDVVSTAQAQFRRWCIAYIRLLRNGEPSSRLVIRLYAGEALAFCSALRHCRITQTTATPEYTAPWRESRINLDDDDYAGDKPLAPLLFDAIDTSNIMDHVGLLNVIISATPLLKTSPSSTLYTEALLSSGNDPLTGFLGHVCCDLQTFSLLTGLIPSTHFSRFTTHSNIHEIMSVRMVSDSPQYHERLAWKITAEGDAGHVGDPDDCTVVFSPPQMADILFSIYLKMFIEEDWSSKFQDLSLSKVRNMAIIHYVRQTFAQFVKNVKSRIQMDWARVMETFCQLVEQDRRLVVGMNNYQDLCCHLHVLDIYCPDWLQPHRVSSLRVDENPKIFHGWKSVPPVVCIVLVVPRKQITDVVADLDKSGTPILRCDIRGHVTSNAFSSIQAVFGTIDLRGINENRRATIVKDVSGTSPLIVSFLTPSPSLMLDTGSTRVHFVIRSTPATSGLAMKLGTDLTIFSANILDGQHVHVLTQPPNIDGEDSKITTISQKVRSQHSKHYVHRAIVTLDGASQSVTSLTIRFDVTDPGAQMSLTSGVAVTLEQVSSYTLQICLGSHKKLLVFPLPVDANRTTTRIARKSMYVEVIAFLHREISKNSSTSVLLNKFLVFYKDSITCLWNIHRVDLDRLPVLNTADPKELKWISPHVSLMFSDREGKAREEAIRDKTSVQDPLINLKDSLHTILISSAGIQGLKMRAFCLCDPSKVNISTLIFISDLRLDLASHTVVADAWVLSLTSILLEKLSDSLAALSGSLLQVKTDAAETRAWKQLLPAITERCRSWHHKSSCEYMSQKVIPLSIEYNENPICSCGQGRETRTLQEVEIWRNFAPYVTRAALSPLFAVSYLENVAGLLPIGGNVHDGDLNKGSLAPEPRASQTSTPSAMRPVCTSCGKDGRPKLLLCSKCRRVSYCSSDCQRKDWKQHKSHCVA